MESGTLITFLFFALLFAVALLVAIRLLQRGSRRLSVADSKSPAAPSRQRLAQLLHDDIGQKFAAARVNLSALRLQLRTGGVPEAAELDAAMNLLDDGCRDLRTVSRLIASEKAAEPSGTSHGRQEMDEQARK